MNKLFRNILYSIAYGFLAFYSLHDLSAKKHDMRDEYCKQLCKKGSRSKSRPMAVGVPLVNSDQKWKTISLVTTGEEGKNGYTFNQEHFNYNPTGLFDGIGTFKVDNCTLAAYTNHELNASIGYPYTLKNGLSLTGARVDRWDLDRECLTVKKGSLAYDTAIDREGIVITDASQINKGREASAEASPFNYEGGFSRFCSGHTWDKNNGFQDKIYFAAEEIPQGAGNAIDVCTKTLHVVPMMGQHMFENGVPLGNHDTNKVVLLFGEDIDTTVAPLWIYIGEIGARPPSNAAYQPTDFLMRNGLGYGKLFAWKADNPNYINEADFKGTGNAAAGKFVAVEHYLPLQPGDVPPTNYDELGFLRGQDIFEFFSYEQGPLQQAAFDKGAFGFFRNEDLHENPKNPLQAAFAATGGYSFEQNPFGRLYILDIATNFPDVLNNPIECITEFDASVRILYDCDDAGGGQFPAPVNGIFDPDNLVWANDGYIYVAEDFGGYSCLLDSNSVPGIWQVDPSTSKAIRIMSIDYTAVPEGQVDVIPTDYACARWEPSGLLDISDQVCNPDGRTILLLDVQAHTITEPDSLFALDNLVQGSQLLVAVGPKPKDNSLLCNACSIVQGSVATREINDCPADEPVE